MQCPLIIDIHMSHAMRNPVLWHMQTTKAQISCPIRVVSSLISVLVFRCLDSTIPIFATCKWKNSTLTGLCS